MEFRYGRRIVRAMARVVVSRQPVSSAARRTRHSAVPAFLAVLVGLMFPGISGGCAWLPSEFNLSPLYRQRLAEDGSPLEVDVLWPIFHYERTPDGGDDFRIRPFYRRVTEPETNIVGRSATEHQFLWPLGRVRSDGQETSHRFFPLYWYRRRPNVDGLEETDWYALFPFVWGGTREDGEESYFGVLPFYADLPNFLTYDRLLFVLWPLYTRTEKNGNVGNLFLWPLVGFGSGPDGHRWHRALPLWMFAEDQAYWRWSILWPFIHFGSEARNTDRPVDHWMLWPLLGHRYGPHVSGWSFLWPFFEYLRIDDRLLKLTLFWPLFRYELDDSTGFNLERWWLWPLVARTVTDRQWAWSVLWPLIWFREYRDPEGTQEQDWFLPVYWRVTREGRDGSHDDFSKIWPFFHRQASRDEDGSPTRGDWSLLSPWPWRESNAAGVEEAYGWIWTLAKGRRRAVDDDSFHLAAHLFTTRERSGRTQTSMPFLFSYESDGTAKTLYLFNLLPIPLGGSDDRAAPTMELPSR